MLPLNKEIGIGKAKLPVWLWLILGAVILAATTLFYQNRQTGNVTLYDWNENDKDVKQLSDLLSGKQPTSPTPTPTPAQIPVEVKPNKFESDERYQFATRPMPVGSMSIFNPYDPLTDLVTRASLSYGDMSDEAIQLRERAKFALTDALWYKRNTSP